MLHPEAVLPLKVSISYKELQFMIFQKSDQNSTAILGHIFHYCENWWRRVFPRGSCCFRGKRVLPNFLAEQCRHLEPFFSNFYKEWWRREYPTGSYFFTPRGGTRTNIVPSYQAPFNQMFGVSWSRLWPERRFQENKSCRMPVLKPVTLSNITPIKQNIDLCTWV